MRLEVRKSSRLVPGNAEAQFLSNQQPPGPRDLSHNDRRGGAYRDMAAARNPAPGHGRHPAPPNRPVRHRYRRGSIRRESGCPSRRDRIPTPLGAPSLARSAAVGSSPRSNALLLPGQPPGAAGWPQSLSRNVLEVAYIATKLCRRDDLVRFAPSRRVCTNQGPAPWKRSSEGCSGANDREILPSKP